MADSLVDKAERQLYHGPVLEVGIGQHPGKGLDTTVHRYGCVYPVAPVKNVVGLQVVQEVHQILHGGIFHADEAILVRLALLPIGEQVNLDGQPGLVVAHQPFIDNAFYRELVPNGRPRSQAYIGAFRLHRAAPVGIVNRGAGEILLRDVEEVAPGLTERHRSHLLHPAGAGAWTGAVQGS